MESSKEPFKPNLKMVAATLGPSRFRIGARINMGIICLASFGTLFFIMLGAPDRGVGKVTFDLDPFALFVFGYVVLLTNLQQSYMEWPFLDPRPLALVVLNLFCISLSTIMLQANLLCLFAEGHSVPMVILSRLPVWIANFVLGNRAYVWTVRGPLYVPDQNCLENRTCIITGCNTGIGYLTAVQMAQAGGTIIFACRNKKKAEDAIEQLHKDTGNTLQREKTIFMELDVSSMAKVRQFAKEYEESGRDIHVLLCNAGVINAERSITKDGLDNTLTANCLGHFLLLELLLPIMKKTEAQGGSPRIVMVTSALAFDQPYYDWSNAVKATTPEEREEFSRKPFSMFPCYAQSKYIQMLTMCHLARKLKAEGSRIPINAVHPGEVLTEVTREFPQPIPWLVTTFEPFVLMLMKSPHQGSQGNVFACTSPTLKFADDMTGQYMMRLEKLGNVASWDNPRECELAYNICLDLVAENA